MSISLLHSPLNISETIEIKASFQRTTGSKWPMTHQMVTWPSCIVQLQHEWSSDVTDDGTITVKYISGPLCIVQLDDMQSWAVITRLLTHKDKNFLAVYLQILNWLQSRRLFIRCWSQCWYWVAWTTGTPLWSEFRLPLCRHLQSVLNAAARSVAGLRRSDHIIETLARLHWLCASECIQFKLAMLVFRSLHGLAPQYLVDDLIHG